MATGLVVVKQYERMIKFRLGKFVGPIKDGGLHFLIPVLESGIVIDTREIPERVPTQQYITVDNVVVNMDFVLYYRVIPELADRAVLEVVEPGAAVRNLAMAELRSIIGNVSLAEALSERERIQGQLQAALDENTERWGIKVQGVAINEIDPPEGVKAAMEREKSAAAIKTAEITESEGQRQAQINRAEGEKQAAILSAEGERQSAILTAEGTREAAILNAAGYANALDQVNTIAQDADARTMSLQYFDTLKELGEGSATKFIFPLEFTSMIQSFLNGSNNSENNDI
ncbi:MAG: SPFH/Band 7/PHB domain protein [SAR202 cluster bacterium]|nr:SPFH/Band 7/PHB domain protein [SAR202 cluster bacterium]|tara:strand:- start:5775 stop:6635 length:861 start_codon:yes stop_codon:yes gene_type:complete